MSPRGDAWVHGLERVAVFVSTLVGLVLLFTLGSMLACCGGRQAEVRPVRAATTMAADALSVVGRLELARIKQLAIARMDACDMGPGEKACRTHAVDTAAADEAPRVALINRQVATQQRVAEAVVVFDNCAANGGNVEACEAKAFVALASLAPVLASLIREVRAATTGEALP